MKLSRSKATLPGKKQVYRLERKGIYQEDIIGLEKDKVKGKKLLHQFMNKGRLIEQLPSLDESAKYYQSQLIKFSPKIRLIERNYHYPVTISKSLRVLAHKTERLIRNSSK
ncbi:MAG: hypothetical protein A2588_02825 [Candidatus Veblenbacteria bacterium RIFOXYD1_FULL_43_11]|uniref:Nicotinate phosphoribosyltransferase C-terminal domain-containing protein n=1 Tax=Candidatus Veblenbacteria bacterium RIFOXYD1_FULL_43_11 TaxID=1802429 RepID=A0A1G2Q6X1_9BACT|nr:MAG: hypothetical protein A2588_02825 [Candidatus Veblenbacteria bacterium RIFOXYD1_FULL_43_11]